MTPRDQFAEFQKRVGGLPSHKQLLITMLMEQGVHIGREMNPAQPVTMVNNQTSTQSQVQNASPTVTVSASPSPPPATAGQRIAKGLAGFLKFVITDPLKALIAIAVILVVLGFAFPRSKILAGALNIASQLVRRAKAFGDTTTAPRLDSLDRAQAPAGAASRGGADSTSRVAP